MNKFILIFIIFCQLTLHGKEAGSPVMGEMVASSRNKTSKYSASIDSIINASLTLKKITPQPQTDDETFLRRVYLDTVGRIPTAQEYKKFIKNYSSTKRSKLIDELLKSPGHEVHMYNFIANLLRVQGSRYGGMMYVNWVKEQIRKNVPWDKFVYSLIAAEGNTGTNPAVGFYLRDEGMPLDNMSNTAQIFLGTRFQCAQCHDHPFDVWKQKDFYALAAFTYPVMSYGGLRKYNEKIDVRKLKIKFGPFMKNLFRSIDKGAFVNGKKLKFPHDYQYDNAKPKAEVSAQLPFAAPRLAGGDNTSNLKKYAAWMTGPDNPRFTKVIVNRLWKRLMGKGIFEPVDNLQEDTVISHPKLLDKLVEVMKACKYDMRKFQAVVLKTEAYQKQVSLTGHDYNGPALRRMTAEQLFDSFLGLMIEDLDTHLAVSYPVTRKMYMDAKQAAMGVVLSKSSYSKSARIYKKTSDLYAKFRKSEQKLRIKIAAAKSRREKDRLAQQIKTESYKFQTTVSKMIFGTSVKHIAQLNKQPEEMKRVIAKVFKIKFVDLGGGKKGVRSETSENTRSSRAGWPVGSTHFLRVFGSSDFEVIENSSNEATIPQSLWMLNGRLPGGDLEKGYLARELASARSMKEKIQKIFISTYTRMPTSEEVTLCVDLYAAGEKDYEKNKDNKRYRRKSNLIVDLVRAIVNTKRFIFIE